MGAPERHLLDPWGEDHICHGCGAVCRGLSFVEDHDAERPPFLFANCETNCCDCSRCGTPIYVEIDAVLSEAN